jgi:Coenzyme PQQ synthesis protein D (PqqD)
LQKYNKVNQTPTEGSTGLHAASGPYKGLLPHSREIAIVTDIARDDAGLRPDPDVLSKRLDHAAVLVHIATNRIFELNETGTRVWELVCQGLDADHIVRQLIDEFDVEPPRAAHELNELITQLRNEGLLVT